MQVTRLAKLGTGQTTLSISEGANMMLALAILKECRSKGTFDYTYLGHDFTCP